MSVKTSPQRYHLLEIEESLFLANKVLVAGHRFGILSPRLFVHPVSCVVFLSWLAFSTGLSSVALSQELTLRGLTPIFAAEVLRLDCVLP